MQDNDIYTIVEFQHVKPGKGGAFVRTKLRNARSGAVIDRTFRAGEKMEQAVLERRPMQYLYHLEDDYCMRRIDADRAGHLHARIPLVRFFPG